MKVDCRFFTGEKPCRFHKQTGADGQDCRHYSPVKEKILIIKMGAMGDVLRTTCILPGLKEKYPDSHVTWVVEKGSGELLANIPAVDRVMEYSSHCYPVLMTEEFDLLLGLDSSPVSGGISQQVKSREKRGFGLSKDGKVYPFNRGAERWFAMGVSDNLKRANTRTYQEIVCRIARVDPTNQRVIINLTGEEKQFASMFAKEHKISGAYPVIGLNTGAGDRWRYKKWTLEGYLELVGMLGEEVGGKVLLFGGAGDSKRNRWLAANSGTPVLDTGSSNTLRQFFALLGFCDVVVTGDTLAAHAAVGLDKSAVVLFGPTSPSEVDLYGRGEKVVAPVDCVGCYRNDCDREPSCMDAITAQMVLDAVKRLLSRGKRNAQVNP